MNHFNNYSVNNFFDDLGKGLHGVVTDKGLVIIAMAASGFMRVLMQDSDITRDFALITFIAFGVMTLLGVGKHVKTGETDAKVFFIKTGIQLTVMVAVIIIGYLFAIAIFSVRQIVGRIGITDIPKGPNVGMYFVYSGYMITFTYHSLKSLDLIDQLMPEYVPAWFSATFRRFRRTGQFADLLKTPTPTPDKPENQNPGQ